MKIILITAITTLAHATLCAFGQTDQPDHAGQTQKQKKEPNPSEIAATITCLENILIPEFHFKDAALVDVVNFLHVTPREGNRKGSESPCVSFTLQVGNVGEGILFDPADTFFSDELTEFHRLVKATILQDTLRDSPSLPRINLNLRRVTLKAALDALTEHPLLRATIHHQKVTIHCPLLPNAMPTRDPDSVMDRLEEIIIPELSFTNACLYDLVDFLIHTSVETDPLTGRYIRPPVNIIVDHKTLFRSPPPSRRTPPVTINLKNTSLLNALDLTADLINWTWEIERGVVVLQPLVHLDNSTTRFYHAEPHKLQGIIGANGPNAPDKPNTANTPHSPHSPRSSITNSLRTLGVPFPPGSSVTHHPSLSLLVVYNTPAHHKRLTTILEGVLPTTITPLHGDQADHAAPQDPEIDNSSKLLQRMKTLRIPEISYREANLYDVIDHMNSICTSLSETSLIRAVGIILPLDDPEEDELDDFFVGLDTDQEGFGFDSIPEEDDDSAIDSIQRVSISLHNVTHYDATYFIAKVVGLAFMIENEKIVIYDPRLLKTESYPMTPQLVHRIKTATIATTAPAHPAKTGKHTIDAPTHSTDQDLTQALRFLGIPFPIDATATYQPTTKQITVVNSPNNQKIFKAFLKAAALAQ